MKKLLLLVLCATLLASCAYSDLKAPCGASRAALNPVPCDERQPVALAFHRSQATMFETL